MLVPGVVHAEKQRGQQRQDHYRHGPFQVHTVANMGTGDGYLVRNKQEGFERVKGGVEFRNFPPG